MSGEVWTRDDERAMAEVVVYTLLPLGWDGVRACCRAGLPMTQAHERAHRYVEQRAMDVGPVVREVHRRTLAEDYGLPLPEVPDGPLPPALPEQREPGDG